MSKCKALLLTENALLPDDENIGKILSFFGIPWDVVTCDELSTRGDLPGDISTNKYGVLSSMDVVAKMDGFSDEVSEKLPSFIKKADSVYLYGTNDPAVSERLLRFLTNDPTVEIRQLETNKLYMSINKDCSEICGPMSGLQVPVFASDVNFAFHIPVRNEKIQGMISIKEGSIFVRVKKNNVGYYLNSCRSTIDIDQPIKKRFFDVKDCFCNSVPLIMYVKHVFSDVCWKTRENNACLIVDDPLLRAKYGFFDYQEVLKLMMRFGFSTNIAFIPWNWRRTQFSIADLFKKHPDKFSLSIHGCDHTAGEFGTQSIAVLNSKIKLAHRRMQLHQNKTGVNHDRIMVFPQGVFSKESAWVLKHNNFIAAVNTEVAPLSDDMLDTEISEIWNTAIIKYSCFPIFTRRYPRHGIENFAFDMFLGKPCLIVTHHDYFKNNNSGLISFLENLVSLNCKINWRSLIDVISRSFRERQDINGNVKIQMFGNQLTIENVETIPKIFRIEKQESDADNVQDIQVNQKGIDWDCEMGRINFQVKVPPMEVMRVRVIYNDIFGESLHALNTRYKIKTFCRRYLTEVRDNYICKNDLIYKYTRKLKRFF